MHYSACQNRNSLSKICYILCFSCWKTLAWKHKTSVRQINTKIRSSFSKPWAENSSQMEIPQKDLLSDFGSISAYPCLKKVSRNSRFRFLSKNPGKSRCWNFHLTSLDSIFFLLEQVYEMRSLFQLGLIFYSFDSLSNLSKKEHKQSRVQ